MTAAVTPREKAAHARVAGGWSDEMVAALLKHYEKGLSCSAIAAVMGGGLSRNAIIGKLHRVLGIGVAGAAAKRKEVRAVEKKPPPKKRGRPYLTIKKDRQHRAPVTAVPTSERPAIGAELHACFKDGYRGQTGRVTLLEAKRGDCRYPVTMADGVDLCCGLEASGSYCSAHHARVYTGVNFPAAKRRGNGFLALPHRGGGR